MTLIGGSIGSEAAQCGCCVAEQTGMPSPSDLSDSGAVTTLAEKGIAAAVALLVTFISRPVTA